MPEGGTLRLWASSKRIIKEGLEDVQRTHVEIGVEDTGKGMGKEVIQNITKSLAKEIISAPCCLISVSISEIEWGLPVGRFCSTLK